MILFQTALQRKIYQDFDPSKMSYEEKIEMSKAYCLYLHEEVSEVMQSLKYKNYHKYHKEYTEESTKIEIVDCLKFVLNLGILWGMDANDFEIVFDKKSEENNKRITSNEK